ncbi:MAG: ABC transporter permease subunit [Oscillospiraceae bacterium]|nr:ABC transporter permease subunit [Oscillospiraceae bacterium]
MTAILKRELYSYFISPVGYIFITVFLLVSGAIFTFTNIQGNAADISFYFMCIIFTFIVLIPLLTMRSLSEERKTKTEQMLLTSPVSLTGMIFAKFLAAFVLFASTLLVSCLSFYVLYRYAETPGQTNSAVLIGNVISILLIGAAFIAIGLFISAMTEDQLTAAVVSIATLLFLLLSGTFSGAVGNAAVRYVLDFVSIFSRFSAFTYGIFDISAIIYYASIVVIFLFLTIRIYEMRRWQ